MMKKRRIVILVAVILSIVFGSSYIVLCKQIVKEHSQTFYVVQVGAFSTQENSNEMVARLESHNLKAYTYTNDNLIYVLSSLSTDEQEISNVMKTLSDLQISNVKRDYTYKGSKTLSIDVMLEFLGGKK